jgi:glutamate/tyrosine decarboxylase-like PLP-dependent enzyme
MSLQPYDNGIFFTRKSSILTEVFKNPNAAYLSSDSPSTIQSPLNIGLENSRRFRALPVYAVLMSEGREGISRMMERMVLTARAIARAIQSCNEYVLLPDAGLKPLNIDEDIHIVVLFRAKADPLNEVLVQRINEGNRWYVSGSSWGGKPAVRVAVSSWRADYHDAFDTVRQSLMAIAQAHKNSLS